MAEKYVLHPIQSIWKYKNSDATMPLSVKTTTNSCKVHAIINIFQCLFLRRINICNVQTGSQSKTTAFEDKDRRNYEMKIS